jgi:hypothetical protein
MKSKKTAFLSLQKQLAEKNPYWGLAMMMVMMADELVFACYRSSITCKENRKPLDNH